MITIEVSGTPAPKGSNRAIMRGGRARFVPGSSNAGRKRMDSWAKAVRAAALDACATVITGKPITVEITFWMPRPKGHVSKRHGTPRPSAPTHPAVKPDLDKLARCTLDALSKVAYDDDARIVELKLCKAYGFKPGADIVIREAV